MYGFDHLYVWQEKEKLANLRTSPQLYKDWLHHMWVLQEGLVYFTKCIMREEQWKILKKHFKTPEVALSQKDNDLQQGAKLITKCLNPIELFAGGAREASGSKLSYKPSFVKILANSFLNCCERLVKENAQSHTVYKAFLPNMEELYLNSWAIKCIPQNFTLINSTFGK